MRRRRERRGDSEVEPQHEIMTPTTSARGPRMPISAQGQESTERHQRDKRVATEKKLQAAREDA